MNRKIEIGILCFVTITSIVFGINRILLDNESIYSLLLAYLSPLSLAAFYLWLSKDNMSAYTPTIIGFMILPVGILFYIMYWPFHMILLYAGLFAYLSAGILILYSLKDNNLNITAKVSLIFISLIAIYKTVQFFVPMGSGIGIQLNFILLLSCGYYWFINFNKNEENKILQLVKLIGINAVLPVCTMLVKVVADIIYSF
jgi:hypothetical protein